MAGTFPALKMSHTSLSMCISMAAPQKRRLTVFVLQTRYRTSPGRTSTTWRCSWTCWPPAAQRPTTTRPSSRSMTPTQCRASAPSSRAPTWRAPSGWTTPYSWDQTLWATFSPSPCEAYTERGSNIIFQAWPYHWFFLLITGEQLAILARI